MDDPVQYGRIDILRRAAEAATDVNDKEALTRMAAGSEGYGKGDLAYWTNCLEWKCKNWPDKARSPRKFFTMIETCLEVLKIYHEGEWVKNDFKKGISKWQVSYRKFKHFRDKAYKLEAENAALKAAIHALTEGKKNA